MKGGWICLSAPPFYGLTLTLEDKVRIHQEIFHLIYNSNGSITHDEAYSMPVYLRYFYLKMLIDQKQKENELSKDKDNSSYSPTQKNSVRNTIKKPF